MLRHNTFEKKILESLQNNSHYFMKFWASPVGTWVRSFFLRNNRPFKSFRIKSDTEPKFLGRI
jgi:hypothetical protein